MSRRQRGMARRAARSGSGPIPLEAAPPRWPGAANTFSLVGAVITTGLLVTAGSVAVISFPSALATGIRHLRRGLKGDVAPMGRFWRELLAALPGGLLVGAAGLAAALLLLLNISFASSGALPGGGTVAAASWVALAGVVLLIVSMAGRWTPGPGWRRTLRPTAAELSSDPVGALFILAAAAFAVLVARQFFPLIIPALGCVALAVVAAPERRRAAADA
ncbi:hypothetical protein ABIB35_003344 [Arthrobacter sp. UYP6]|uniref:hypothetical protein n=1 Tax=Arthrobacter sp. UYP6 TaxID=1756378 RepID=UPI0033955D43